MTNITTEFRTFVREVEDALVRAGFRTTTTAVLDVADALFKPASVTGHEALVSSALNDTGHFVYMGADRDPHKSVLAWLLSGQKILAIKRLRAMTNCGLKEAKDAVEDSRVQSLVL